MPKSTLAEANEKKDWRIYQDFGYVLIQKAKKLYEGEKLRIDLDEMVCAFDSSTIELCLTLCPWATLHHGRGGFKMHTLMDLKGSIPIFIRLTEASIHDSKVMDEIPIVANAQYLMDKGYVKFESLYKHFHQNHAWFVTRAKDNMLYTVTESREVALKQDLFPMRRYNSQDFILLRSTQTILGLLYMRTLETERPIASSRTTSRLTQSPLQSCIEKDGRLRSSSSGSSSTCISRPFTAQPAMLFTRKYG